MSFLILAWDITIFYWFNDLAGVSRIFDAFIIFSADYLWFLLVVILAVLLYFSSYAKKEKIRIFGVALVSAAVARLAVTEIIRLFYHRPRPFTELQVNQLVSDNAWSFPSGHSTFLFAMAAAIYLYNKKWGIWFFAGSVLVAVSRVIGGVHYPSDILGGAAIGLLVAYVVFHFAKRKTQRSY